VEPKVRLPAILRSVERVIVSSARRDRAAACIRRRAAPSNRAPHRAAPVPLSLVNSRTALSEAAGTDQRDRVVALR
jgi:hypothetical protein